MLWRLRGAVFVGGGEATGGQGGEAEEQNQGERADGSDPVEPGVLGIIDGGEEKILRRQQAARKGLANVDPALFVGSGYKIKSGEAEAQSQTELLPRRSGRQERCESAAHANKRAME